MLDSRLWPTALSLLLAAALAAGVFASSQWSYRAAWDSQVSLTERGEVRQALGRILRHLNEAESAQRGYFLTGRVSYLAPYGNAGTEITKAIELIGPHYAREKEQEPAFLSLRDMARSKLSEMQTTVAQYDAGNHDAWRELLLSDIGREKMEAARSTVLRLQAYEDARIARERAIIYQVLDRGRLGVQITTLLALVWLVFFLRQNRALQRAQRAYAQDLKAQRDTLEKRVTERTAELRELNEHLQDVREIERSKLARQLHDDLGSLLTAAKLDVTRLKRALPPGQPEAAERLAHLARTIDDGVMLKRRVIEDLSPSALHSLGLRTALEILVSDFRRRSGMQVELDVDEHLPLADSPRIVVYRLVQECLDNMQRHAGAPSGRVRVRQAQSQVLVEVSDDGAGFDPTAVPPTSHGLRKLRHRIEALGGRLAITSMPGRGTEVQAHLPLVVPGWDAPPGAVA